MEFKFRAVDDRPISYILPSSGFRHSSTQVPGVGFPSMDFPINHDPMRNPMRNHIDYWEAIVREREKERIREEILATEIAKRRVLEAEVRRELAVLEREMAIRRGGPEGLSLEERWVSRRFDGPRLPPSHPLDDPLPFHSRSTACDMFPLPRHPDAISPDLKPSSDDKLIVLAKPKSNLSGAKRKAMAPAVVPFSLKKPKEEWSCALCQFSAISQRKLNEHLEGAKHKALEEELRARRKRKNPKNSPLLKKMTWKRYKLTESNDAGNSILGAYVEQKSLKHYETWNGSAKKSRCIKDMKFKREELLMQKFKHAENTNKMNGAEIVQKVEKTAELKNKNDFKFWCELCQVGAYSETVMKDHKKGKKHMESLQHNETWNGSEKEDDTKDIEFKSEEQPAQKFQSSENLNEVNGAELVKGEEKPAEPKDKKNFRFWCEICQVGANCVIKMEEHKNGKRHMAKLKLKVRPNGSERKKENTKDVLQESKSKIKKQQMQKCQNSKKLNEKNAAETVQGVEKKAQHKDFKFWCEICEVGAYCPVVMKDHKGGKKHFRRVEEVKTK
ncbi:uncharacterized protein LOC107426596 [Ziziphus jujuba]|uniref:Uncharacterized protein LOC107426596 n=1 Tax=Ziziphus jujuba TaxID=326968 RepID=A0A6P4B1V4_ZIZJJ|nr:uncharacterized protein LOC107426596 [Ziziphus jujuba]